MRTALELLLRLLANPIAVLALGTAFWALDKWLDGPFFLIILGLGALGAIVGAFIAWRRGN